MTTRTHEAGSAHDANSRWAGHGANCLLWTIQALLAALFLFAGGVKLVLPIEAMAKQIFLPGWLLRFIGAMEVLGAVGLIVPWLLGIKRILTPLAASGLVVIMSGATTIMLENVGVKGAAMPFVVGVLLTFVAYARWSVLNSMPAESRALDFCADASVL